jgi:hypothetical protein
MDVPSFVLDRLMNKFDNVEGEIIRWAPVIGGGDGYVILWEDGSYLHSYRHPEDFL